MPVEVGDRVRLWMGPPKRGGWQYGEVFGVDDLDRPGIHIRFDRLVNGQETCYATHQEVELLSKRPRVGRIVPMTHTERDVHDEHDCWIPTFVAWAEGQTQTLDLGGRAVPERLQRLLTALEPRDHVLALTKDGWTLQHPLVCRPNLAACWLNRHAARISDQLLNTHGRDAYAKWEVLTEGEDITDVRRYDDMPLVGATWHRREGTDG